MIQFNCYQHESIKYEAAFDPATGSLAVSGGLTIKLALTIPDLRARYGAADLLAYVYADDTGQVSVGVFPSEGVAVSDARKAYLRQQWAGNHLLLMAEIPAVSAAWTDAGVRVVSINSFTDLMEAGHEITVTATEPGVTRDVAAAYLQNNPLRITWAIERGTVIHAPAV